LGNVSIETPIVVICKLISSQRLCRPSSKHRGYWHGHYANPAILNSPNLTFEIDDANQDWTFPSDSFDFIHIRFLLGCISDWYAFYKEAFRCTKPGGWLEHQEVDPIWRSDTPFPEDSPLGQLNKVYPEAGRKSGRSFTLYADNVQQKCMEAAGFVDIQVMDIKVPFGNWPENKQQKELGIVTKAVTLADLTASLPLKFQNQALSTDILVISHQTNNR